jgi:hypothetical protein
VRSLRGWSDRHTDCTAGTASNAIGSPTSLTCKGVSLFHWHAHSRMCAIGCVGLTHGRDVCLTACNAGFYTPSSGGGDCLRTCAVGGQPFRCDDITHVRPRATTVACGAGTYSGIRATGCTACLAGSSSGSAASTCICTAGYISATGQSTTDACTSTWQGSSRSSHPI